MVRKIFVLILVFGFVVLGGLSKSFADVGLNSSAVMVKEAKTCDAPYVSKSLYRKFLDRLELGIKGYGGNMSYRQSYDVYPVESDWSAAFAKIDFDAKIYMENILFQGLRLGYLVVKPAMKNGILKT
ncbi:MAG: hypothetical protein AB1755_03145 [Candidatus Omnitrophota bacterium]